MIAMIVYLLLRFVINPPIKFLEATTMTLIIITVIIMMDYTMKKNVVEEKFIDTPNAQNNAQNLATLPNYIIPIATQQPSPTITQITIPTTSNIPNTPSATPTTSPVIVATAPPAVTLENRGSDMEYSDANTFPMAEGYKSRAYEYGYSFLPPEKWYPVPPHPPMCVTNQPCEVSPVFTAGAPIDAKDYADVREWDLSRKILQPDNINLRFISEKLNAGKA